MAENAEIEHETADCPLCGRPSRQVVKLPRGLTIIGCDCVSASNGYGVSVPPAGTEVNAPSRVKS